MSGRLIDFEGIDKAGRTTQIGNVAAILKVRRIKLKVYKYPSKHNLYGRLLRDFIKNRINLDKYEQILLFLLDMSKDQSDLDRKLKEGYTVILDRYFISTLAYQTEGEKDYKNIKEIIRILHLRMPDVVVYLDITPNTSLYRLKTDKAERFEGDLNRLRKTRKNYLRLKKEGFPVKDWINIDASKDIDMVNLEVSSKIESIIKTK